MLANSPAGLSETDPSELGGIVLQCWDAFVDLISDPATDLTGPSRLKGWTGVDTIIHLGNWPDSQPLEGIVDSARHDAAGEGADADHVDARNDRLVRAHRAEGAEGAVAACVRARDAVEEFVDSALPAELGRALSHSSLGPLPVMSLLHAGVYELAVHALDLAPCGAPAPSDLLLDRGLAALIDVTGALASRQGVTSTVTAQSPTAGWAFTSTPDGWTTQRVPSGKVSGAGVRAPAADLLDVSAGRANLVQMLLSRRLVVQDLPAFMKLAPLLDDVPGLPGGRTLKAAAGGLGRVTKLLRLGR